MITITCIIFLLSLCILGYAINSLKKAKKLKVSYEIDQQEADKTVQQYKQEIQLLQQQKDELNLVNTQIQKEKQLLLAEKIQLLQEIEDKRKNIQAEYQQAKKEAQQALDNFKENTSYAGEQYFAQLEKRYDEVDVIYQNKLNALEKEKLEAQQEVDKIKNLLRAAVEAQLREQEKKDKLGFYKIELSHTDLSDITELQLLRQRFHQPVLISKLIWTTYIQKQISALCRRVVGENTVCGIYRITNLETQQCYVGQSRDISQRWKDHCKCGCGIDASATNKLYNAMQTYGVWNFTFEVLEECSKEELNEKEKKWIELYQSNTVGYNGTKGGS